MPARLTQRLNPELAECTRSMTIRSLLILLFLALIAWASLAQRDRPEAFQISRDNVDQMPSGKERGRPSGRLRPEKRQDRGPRVRQSALSPRQHDDGVRISSPRLPVRPRRTRRRKRPDHRLCDQAGNRATYPESRLSRTVRPAPPLSSSAHGGYRDGLYSRHEYRLESDWPFLLVTSTSRKRVQAIRIALPGTNMEGARERAGRRRGDDRR